MIMETLVKIENSQAVTNSLLVAEKFNKNHRDVIRSIRDLLSSAQNCAVLQMSLESSYKASNGKTNSIYMMNRYGFSCIVKQIKKIFVRIEKFYTFVMHNTHNVFGGKKSQKIFKPVRAVWSGDILYLQYVSYAAYGFLNLTTYILLSDFLFSPSIFSNRFLKS
ncbi:Rha family transcriptional regulator [Apibacter sp. B3706]|nr:Rha family transcriptional regulator [Apibacter sp. B3706]